MTRRELVASPYDVNAGDRVEVETGSPTAVVTMDLLHRDAMLWFGLVSAASAGALSMDGRPVVVGMQVAIDPAAYLCGRVFVRRRSREDQTRVRARELSRG